MLIILTIILWNGKAIEKRIVRYLIDTALNNETIMNKLADQIKVGRSSVSEATFYNTRLLSVPFTHNGMEYNVFLPYNRRKSKSTTFHIEHEDGSTEQLKHHPNILFNVKCTDLQCIKIHVRGANDEHISTHEGDDNVNHP